MIGRRAVIGLSLLSALLVCAFAAQSASAIVTKHSLNTTMVTCAKVPDGKQQFAEPHCDTDALGKGNFAHVKRCSSHYDTSTLTNTEPAAGQGFCPFIFEFDFGELFSARHSCSRLNSKCKH